MKTGSDRVDDLGRAYAGSQLQIQIYVNRRQRELNSAIVAALLDFSSSTRLDWVSPVEISGFEEYRDLEFLDALDLKRVAMDLAEFWPRRGPVWDALAKVQHGPSGAVGVLLVEGKSYPGEMRSGGADASEGSLETIEASLDRTRTWLGARKTSSWTGDLYQFANRLAHLYFFRKIVQIPAWLISLNFVDDPHHPTTIPDWQRAMAAAKSDLGIEDTDIPFYADVYLPARARPELVED